MPVPNWFTKLVRACPKLVRLPVSQGDTEIAVVTGPVDRGLIMSMREPGVFESHIKRWLNQYDSVIVDTSPISLNNGGNLPPEHVAGVCGAAILTVLAGKTTNTALANTLAKLNQAEVLLLGTVINDQFNPTLRNELLRELGRLEPHFPRLAEKLRSWLNRCDLLALEV